MKRAILLALAALLAMLILVPMAMGQGLGNTTIITNMAGPSGPAIPESGGPAIALPAASMLLGSVILTYAILRRR